VKTRVLATFQDLQRILVVCPRCGGIHRLSELKLSYRAKPKRTWLDELRDKVRRMDLAEERFEEQKSELRGRAQEKGRRQLPSMLKKCVPGISRLGYYPQDLKPMFDPVDFVVFDGMTQRDSVRKLVLLDGPPRDKRRERIQNSLRRVLKLGSYEWRTVRLGADGRVLRQT
jgi:predicted Holliday junction resolvase-like endonuclease